MLGLQLWRARDWLDPGKTIRITLKEFWQRVNGSPDTKNRFLEQRREFIQQKIDEGGGRVAAVVTDTKIGRVKQSGSSVKGPEYDFWSPAAHAALFGPGGEVVDFDFRGETLQGIWRRAKDLLIPDGVYCRSQDKEFDGQSAKMDATASNGDAGLAMQALADLATSSSLKLPEPAQSSAHLQAASKTPALRNEPNVLPIMDEGHAESSESRASASPPFWPLSTREPLCSIADTALEVSVMCRKGQLPKSKMIKALNLKVSKEIDKAEKAKKADKAFSDTLVEMANALEYLDNLVDTEVKDRDKKLRSSPS